MIEPKVVGTYRIDMKCSNCGTIFTQDFCKGATCTGYYECPNCECCQAKAIIIEKAFLK